MQGGLVRSVFDCSEWFVAATASGDRVIPPSKAARVPKALGNSDD